MGRSKLFLLLALCLPALADTGLDALRASMVGMRGKDVADPSLGPRGATPQLTVAKHQLRDWVESRLKEMPPGGDGGLLHRDLNAALDAAGLFCDREWQGRRPCPEWTLSGYLEEVEFHWSQDFLILKTGLGIECGFDESAYVYAHSDEGWKRVWQTEQNAYTEKEYKPQTIEQVLISPRNPANDYIALTLGAESWCSSVWHRVYYRAFRLGPFPDASPLLDGSQIADTGYDADSWERHAERSAGPVRRLWL